jgi:hypothetical protein
LVFPTVFLRALGESAGAVASLATFAVAFAARPFGAVLIGLLPSADGIGVAAPILLVALRFAQGLVARLPARIARRPDPTAV